MTTQEITKLYKILLLLRKCEESFVEPIINSTIKCPVHLYSGQEAIAVGFVSQLRKNDIIFGNHRSHGHYLAKGGDLDKMVAEIYCKETGCAKGRGGSMHIVDQSVGMLGAAPIVAGTVSLTLGSALIQKRNRKKQISVAFFGDGATGEGVLFEAMNFASMRKLPIIFACENNYYSTHLPIKETRTATEIYKLGQAFGIKSFQVDGNDVLKTMEIGSKAIDICRLGEGPVFIEFKTYRIRGHVGPSDNIQGTHTDIRPKSEIERWVKKDPIRKLERHLLKNGVLTKERIKIIEREIEKKVIAAHEKAINDLWPKAEEYSKYVFR